MLDIGRLWQWWHSSRRSTFLICDYTVTAAINDEAGAAGYAVANAKTKRLDGLGLDRKEHGGQTI